MAKQSIKHHYVPKSILKNFSTDSKGNQVYVFDKNLGKGHFSSIGNAGAENQFNTVSTDFGKLNLEWIFDDPDSKIAPIIKRIVNANSFADLSPEELMDLFDYVLVQYLRTNLRRDTLSHVQTRVREELKKLGPQAILDEPILSDEEIKFVTLEEIQQRSDIMDFFSDKSLLLYKTDGSNFFWISDNPIVKYNTSPFGGRGLKDRGIEIYFPISKTLAIVIFCNSIFERWKFENPGDFHSIERFQGSKHGILVDKKVVDFINILQIMQSSRFIFSNNDDSGFIERFLEKNPQYKVVSSDIKVGDMGKGPTMRTSMPKGLYLIVFVSDLHFMIPITMEKKAFVISFYTKDIHQLKLIDKIKRFDKAEVYSDGKVIRSIPDAILRNVDFSGISANEIGYLDRWKEDLFTTVLKK